VSYLHPCFNAETCQSYIHTLRWKDRPLQCPRCQSDNVGPWGTYHAQPGLKRYRCKAKGYQRTGNDLTGNDLTGTLWDGSKRSLSHWILATFLLCRSCSSRRIARELGRHIRHGYRCCWWLRNAALSYEIGRKLAGTVEADDLYPMQAGSKLYPDSASSYRLITGYEHDSVNHTKKEDARGDGHENRAECLVALLKSSLRVVRGISKTTLPGYVGFFQFLRNVHQLTAFEQAERIVHAALEPSVANKARKGEFVRSSDHFDLLQSPTN